MTHRTNKKHESIRHRRTSDQMGSKSEPIIERVHIFGSRVRGEHRPDSDIDMAVELDLKTAPGVDFSGGFATFSFQSKRWKAQLAELLPMPVDLDFYAGPKHTPILHAGLRRSSRLIY